MKVAELLKRYVPGFEDLYILSTGQVVGVRETRRLVGHYVLTKEDLLSGKIFDDRIAINAYTIDIHDPKGSGFTQYEVPAHSIPYRSLLPKEVDNLLVAGRCISTTREAQGSIRVTPCCMATGQAAGVAATLDVSKPLKDIDIEGLQSVLKEQNAFLA